MKICGGIRVQPAPPEGRKYVGRIDKNKGADFDSWLKMVGRDKIFLHFFYKMRMINADGLETLPVTFPEM